MRKRVRHRGCIAATAGLVAILTFVGLTVLRPGPGLLDHAHRLADADTWMPTFGGYFWETDYSVLTFRPVLNGVRAVTVDLRTGAETPRSMLSDDILAGGPQVSSWRLSPDGRLFLWRKQMNGKDIWNASTLDGTRVKSWSTASSSLLPSWLPDSRRWLSAEYVAKGDGNVDWAGVFAVVHSLSDKDSTTHLYTSASPWQLGIGADNRLVTMQYSGSETGEGGGTARWTSQSVTDDFDANRQGVVRLPKPAMNLFESELSHSGARVACLSSYSYMSPLEQFIARFAPTAVHEHSRYALWILSLTGGAPKLIGTRDGSMEGPPCGLLWTRDDRSVSLVDQGVLYRIDIGP